METKLKDQEQSLQSLNMREEKPRDCDFLEDMEKNGLKWNL